MKIVKIQYKDIWSRIDGKEPMNNSPVLDYCRKLIESGKDKETSLEVYREDMLCLIIKEIGEGAKWAILENRDEVPKFIKYEPFPESL